jgi:DNA (cytosine-5)-methyltransferase 1
VDFTQVEPVDMLAGGFPCQDISVAGKGAGLEGARSGLWTEYARAIAEIRPRYALIENSPALVTRGLGVVLSDLASLGYDAEWHCVPASALGAPHKRDRIWIVAYASSNDRHLRHVLGGDRRSNQAEQIGMGCARKAVADTGRKGIYQRRIAVDAQGEDRGPRRVERDGVQEGAELEGKTLANSNAGHFHEVEAVCAGRSSSQRGSTNFPDTLRPGREELDFAALAARAGQCTGASPARWGKAWWATEPGLGRVAHGVAHRVDRLKCIGNGQVPHCTYFFGSLIQAHARQTYSKFSEEK